ncbi:MAG: flippase-like domain-containing protein [Anaerolineales bacterium]|nr:MAG: flippase-like domain-containing protein [Anaerolineales bacterium]
MENDSTEPNPPQLDRIGRTGLRRILLVGLLLAGLYLLIPQLVDMTDALSLIRQASLLPVISSLVCQGVSYVSHAYVVRRILLAFGARLRLWRVLQITLASAFATMLLPSAGLSGIALRARYLNDDGCSLGETFLTSNLEALGQSAAYSLMVLGAFVVHLQRGQVPPWTSLALLASMAILGTLFLVVALSDPHKRDWRYALLVRLNAIRRRWGRTQVAATSLEQRLVTLRQAVRTLGSEAGAQLLLGNLGRAVFGALSLQLVLVAFGQAMPFHATVISFSLSDVLGGLTALPAGLLVTETTLTALLVRYGVSPSVALAATLTFRLIAVWLPRLVGVGAWINLQRQCSRPLW